MSNMLSLWEKPIAEKMYLIAGWRQWADAGAISSGLPQYLIELTKARKIGEIKADACYLFQVPGTHHLLRPTIRFEDGYRRELETRTNEFYYAGNEETGLIIFLGSEPHMNVEAYANAFLTATKQLMVNRVASLGGVYGSIPYHRDRHISCIYSLPYMREELSQYALNFSDYEGGASIDSYLIDRAEREGVELFGLYGFVPAYDFAHSPNNPQGIRIENDFKAWHDLLRRFNHMFDLGLDLSDLQRRSDDLLTAMDEKIAELIEELPQLKVQDFLKELDGAFTETSFMPLDDVWEQELDDIFRDLDD